MPVNSCVSWLKGSITFYILVKIRCLALSESMQKIGENVNVSMDIIVSSSSLFCVLLNILNL